MKKMTFALACASTLALFADGAWTNATGFEGTVSATDPYGSGDTLWVPPADDGSVVKIYSDAEGGDPANLAKPTVSPASGTFGSKYLALDTNGGELTRKFASEGSRTLAETGTYIDTMVQFTATEDVDADGPDVGEDGKLAIWLQAEGEDSNKTYTLCVKAAVVDDQGGVEASVFKLSANVQPETWHRLTVKAIADITGKDGIPGFRVYLDGVNEPLVADKMTVTDEYAELLENDLIDSKTVFASLQGVGDATLTSVGFKGSGAIDELVLTDEDLFPEPDPEGDDIPFTITVADGMTAEWSADGGETWTSYEEGATVPAGTEGIMVQLTNAYGVSKTTTATIGEENDFDYTETELFNKVTPTVTLTGATATIKVGEAAYVAETAYEEGAVITVADVAAAEGYKNPVTVTVTVDGAVVADYSEGIAIGEETESVSIEVTATALATSKFTVTPGANSKATYTIAGEASTATEITEGQDYVVTFTADEGYAFAADAQTEVTGTAETSDITVTGPDATAINYTITYVYQDSEGTTIDGVSNENATSFTIASDDITIDTAKITKDGYDVTSVSLATIAKGTKGDQTVTVTLTKKAAYPTYIGDDPAKQAKYEAWAKEYGADTTSAYEKAYLLNVAPAEAEAEAGKFKITSITIDAEGNVTVEAPAKNSKDAAFNGTVEVKGAATVDAAKYELETTDPTARFFKAFLK